MGAGVCTPVWTTQLMAVYTVHSPLKKESEKEEMNMKMKMIIAIVQDEDNQKVNAALMEKGFRATRLATSGGFLRAGNTTMMIGVEEERLDEALDTIRQVCHPRTQTVSAPAPTVDTTGFFIPYPVEVTVGGATIFVLDVDQFIRV